MEIPLNDRKRRMLEEYLQDLLMGAKNTEELDILVEILLALQEMGRPNKRKKTPKDRSNREVNSRCHLYKMSAEGIQWIGFVKGLKKSKGILPSLSPEDGAFYFLYDEHNGKVVEFLENRTDRDRG